MSSFREDQWILCPVFIIKVKDCGADLAGTAGAAASSAATASARLREDAMDKTSSAKLTTDRGRSGTENNDRACESMFMARDADILLMPLLFTHEK